MVQVIVERGAFEYSICVIQSGEVEKVADTYPPLLTILKKGDVFGYVSWLVFIFMSKNVVLLSMRSVMKTDHAD